MLKILFCGFLLMVISTIGGFAQSKSNDQIEKQIKALKVEGNFKLTYDEAGGTSKIFATGEDFGRAADDRAGVQSFSFGMAFFFAGKTLTAAPDEINLTFWVLAKKPRFAEAHQLIVVAGSEILDLGEARYVAKTSEKMEYLNFKIPREIFVKIGKSSGAKIKIGSVEFDFTPEHLKTFAAMVRLSDPSLF